MLKLVAHPRAGVPIMKAIIFFVQMVELPQVEAEDIPEVDMVGAQLTNHHLADNHLLLKMQTHT